MVTAQEEGILAAQDTYLVKLTVTERLLQRKKAQELHKRLNKLGIKVQLKGANNDRNQSVIELSDDWLLVVVENNKLFYHICEDREGNCIKYYYDNEAQLIEELAERLNINTLNRWLK